jgi:hypothetical protein
MEEFDTVGLSNIDIQKGQIDRPLVKEPLGLLNTLRRDTVIAFVREDGIEPAANRFVIIDDEHSQSLSHIFLLWCPSHLRMERTSW